MDNLKKVRKLVKSPTLAAVLAWAKPMRWPIVGISIISVVSALLSLGITLVTKALVDAATGGNLDRLWQFGALMVALYAIQRGLSVWTSFLQMRTSADLQRHLQGMVTKSILGKEYASLKSFHSGELVNRVFSDVSVVKSGINNELASNVQMSSTFLHDKISLSHTQYFFTVFRDIPSRLAASRLLITPSSCNLRIS